MSVGRDFSRGVLELGGLKSRGRSPEMEETEVLGYFCDWCGRAVLWTSDAEEENTASFFRSRARGETGTIFFLTSA